jgi:hypothetical protein
MECDSRALEHSFSPLNAGWDGAARRPYLTPRNYSTAFFGLAFHVSKPTAHLIPSKMCC